MELRQLHYFVAVYEEGSITQAAHRLNIVQPAVSQQLAKLEGELGGTLFQRTSKGLKPTYLGENAYRLFRPLVQGLRPRATTCRRTATMWAACCRSGPSPRSRMTSCPIP